MRLETATEINTALKEHADAYQRLIDQNNAEGEALENHIQDLMNLLRQVRGRTEALKLARDSARALAATDFIPQPATRAPGFLTRPRQQSDDDLTMAVQNGLANAAASVNSEHMPEGGQ